MSRMRDGTVASILAASSLALAPELAAQADRPSALSYLLTTEIGGSPGGEWTVTQGPDLAIAHWPGEEGEVAMVAGPAVGGLPAERVDEFGGFLSVLFDPTTEFGPGDRTESRYGQGIAVVDSVRLDLEEGAADERIAGHEAQHHVLTATVGWRHQAEDGTETVVVDTGTADLWFAPGLPFSWLPFGAHPNTPGSALPLSFWWPEVAGSAVGRLGPRMEGLGLLLRARVRDDARPEENPASAVQLGSVELERSLSVGGLDTAPKAPDPAPWTDLPRIARPRADALQMLFFVLDPCKSLVSSSEGSFRFTVAGPRAYEDEGAAALFVTDDGIDDAYALVAGGPRNGGLDCTLIMLPGETPAPGTFQIAAPEPGPGGLRTGAAVGLHVSAGEEALRRILVLERGQVRIDRAEGGMVSGRLKGEGWSLEPGAGRPPEVLDGLAVEVTFEAAPAAQSAVGGGGGSR